ncbi:BCCT family transporter [Pseudonocardia sp. KRD-184]|uniref:BCCT family transporter n=1 Tax=Pseudonocardia oceani TaxID=2792013 RepID=A0ABS6UGC0_9PSEU|nr:BCCT family transporter [Pseudonocardia oceani]MBW0089430.1 BCCT family transporter [Pseudonocardia oceani]MBW0096436.1 BCCT family transporter [Pseudonocardia oceani]MBW0108753.1 BCCT family transporter [Pseudonocardia oceani]MBW0122981.1 BCCT family transporter [Pseudonocardia oceani]MBW0131254.1 BCCT family transporter [Pseudonocardia oceani]
MDRLARRLGLRTDPHIFFWSAGLMVVFLVLLLSFQQPIGDAFGAGREWITTNLGWFFILGVTSWLVFLIWVATSRYGNLRLGKDGDRPAYSNLSWFAMLFAGGIGTVLMFWGVAEPISHFASPPFAGVEPYSVEASQDAMGISLYHLGLHTWAIFTLPGLAFGYFIYRYDLPMRVSSVFYPFLKEKIHGPIGKTIDVFAVLGTLFGVAVSLGLGTSQINAGLTALTGVPDAVWPKVLIITTLTAVATASIVAGLDKGVRRLSNLNILMAVGLMLFVLIAGDTVFLLRQLIESIGIYAGDIVPLSFWNDSMAQFTDEGGWGWQAGWTVFYWAWTVTWAPFMGVFLARISRGRTIRQFVGGVLVAPAAFTLVWFVVFGWSAMEIDGIGGSGGPISAAVADSVPLAMFAFFDQFPAATLVSGIAVVVVALFFATSSDSASLVVDMLCSGDGEAGPVRQRVFWGLSEGLLAASLIVLGGEAGLAALQEVITVIGLPIFLLVFAMMFALIVGLRRERVPKPVEAPARHQTAEPRPAQESPPRAGSQT